MEKGKWEPKTQAHNPWLGHPAPCKEAKRDGNTEITEIRTQRTQRR